MEPSIRFCMSRDGTQLAYAMVGAGPPLLFLPGFTTNIEFEWRDPEARAWIERVAERRLLVRCQRRGIGASQRDVSDVSLGSQVDDVVAVVDQLGSDQVAILAAYDAAPAAIAYARKHPERVSHLVLWAPFMRERDGGAFDALAELAQQNWRLFLRTWADLCFPTGPPERQRWYAEMVRQSTSSGVVAAYLAFMRDVDIRDLLSDLRVPTLVLHRSGDRYVRPAMGRMIASAIPGATFVPLEGDIGLPFMGESDHLVRIF
jgi:pimeloyl-ACP methyl ester carboxylesterase